MCSSSEGQVPEAGGLSLWGPCARPTLDYLNTPSPTHPHLHMHGLSSLSSFGPGLPASSN